MRKDDFEFGKRYLSLCLEIQLKTEQLNNDMKDLDYVNITAQMGDGIHGSNISKPTERKAMINIPLREKLQQQAESVLGALYERRNTLEETLELAGLDAYEKLIFIKYYSKPKITHKQVAKEVYTTREGVCRALAVIKEKINKIY